MGKLDKVQNLAQVLKCDKSSLLAKDVENAHQIKALLFDMAVYLAQQVLIVIKVVR